MVLLLATTTFYRLIMFKCLRQLALVYCHVCLVYWRDEIVKEHYIIYAEQIADLLDFFQKQQTALAFSKNFKPHRALPTSKKLFTQQPGSGLRPPVTQTLQLKNNSIFVDKNMLFISSYVDLHIGLSI
jgi:hypothetical protein